MVQEIPACDGSIYLCHRCHRSLFQIQFPTMFIKNGLFTDETPTALNLSELESVLIANNILFFKLFKLPKTRWAGMRDKLVNVPINDDDLINTLSTNVTKLLRAPDKASLLPVKLKRKIEYKNFVLKAYIDPTKLVKAVNVLKELGHPGYTNVTIKDTFGDQIEVAIGNLAARNPDDVSNTIKQESKIQAQATKESTGDYSSSDTSDEIEEDEDNVTKYHFRP